MHVAFIPSRLLILATFRLHRVLLQKLAILILTKIIYFLVFVGDIIHVLKKIGDGGWWEGEMYNIILFQFFYIIFVVPVPSSRRKI